MSPAASAPRAARLRRLQRRLEVPMLLLSLAWIALFVVDEVRGLGPVLTWASHAIWAVFVLQFAAEFVLAPDKGGFLRRNWLAALSLALPALRMLRVVRVLRFTRAVGWLRRVRFVRVVGTFNRGMRALARTMRRRGAGYVVALTAVVTFVGAAGMYAFEREAGTAGLGSFGEALWWTAMVMTTMGSEAWPQTTAGRVLCLLLSLYAFAVFGYVTALLASFFVGRDASRPPAEDRPAMVDELARVNARLDALRADLARLREPR